MYNAPEPPILAAKGAIWETEAPNPGIRITLWARVPTRTQTASGVNCIPLSQRLTVTRSADSGCYPVLGVVYLCHRVIFQRGGAHDGRPTPSLASEHSRRAIRTMVHGERLLVTEPSLGRQ
jgi:hypothetical protein